MANAHRSLIGDIILMIDPTSFIFFTEIMTAISSKVGINEVYFTVQQVRTNQLLSYRLNSKASGCLLGK